MLGWLARRAPAPAPQLLAHLCEGPKAPSAKQAAKPGNARSSCRPTLLRVLEHDLSIQGCPAKKHTQQQPAHLVDDLKKHPGCDVVEHGYRQLAQQADGLRAGVGVGGQVLKVLVDAGLYVPRDAQVPVKPLNYDSGVAVPRYCKLVEGL